MNSKKLRLVYNPYSGRRRLINELDTAIRIFQEGGYEVSVHRTKSPMDIEYVASQAMDVECLVVAGGDGSIHQAVNGLMKIPAQQRPILGILPVGTANDIAYGLRLPKKISTACEVIVQGSTLDIDLGQANDRYFINVFSAGLLTDVSPKVDVHIKNRLGQLAYYLKGIETLPTYRPFKVEYELEGKSYSVEAMLLLAVNGISVGGFKQLVPKASIIDGKLDIIIVRDSGWPDTMRMLLHLVGGGKVASEQIVQFQTSNLKVYTERPVLSDLDGEWGPDSPWEIKMGPKLTVLC
ncbi:YegS/Rv2252/BmrU family lipid kinase [Desulfitobacterium sp. THU1]|uniref:diacylglycerol/lipid kinase family protein n=1 Tax=Desulfitobacterium sp. THU1 TaxID=3138072 RepID=UPI00311DB134